ncbi:MAG: pilus assembly protein [Candidatus Melainabacteria bacterium]|nr:pilus assembly protein [Candidatus Melainabacteria bacterium]
MKNILRRDLGAIMVEAAFAIPVFLFLIFGLLELSRIMYIKNALNIAAQQVASSISIHAKRTATYDVASFSTYAASIHYPGAVFSSSQFSFNVTNASNSSTVTNGQADGIASTKVVVNAIFPPPNSGVKVPTFDPGRLFGAPIFGRNGIQLSAQAICFLERSRRPVLN